MRFFVQCLFVLLMAFLVDIVAAVHFITLIDRRIGLAVGTIILMNIMSHYSHAWFIDYPKAWQRWSITLACAAGAAAGTAVVILWEG